MVDRSGLFSLRARPSFIDYCQQTWAKRHFIFANARGKSLRAGDGTYLGRAWIFLNPLLQVTIYVVVFGFILHVSRGMDNYIGFIMIGVIFFGMMGRGLTQGNGVIQGSRSLIGAFSFPRVCLVFSVAVKQVIDDVAPALVAILGALVFQPHISIGASYLLLIPIFVLLHVFACGLTLFTARATAFVPDLRQIISTLQRGLFFLSGVFYDVDRFAKVPVLREVMLANPFYQFLHVIRTIVLDGAWPEMQSLLYLVAVSFIVFALGLVYFWSAEERYANAK
ncbi:ABC transporter permease [Corynebacterium tuberculostearicum]|uniref:ABC transporter permease n=1 Tax=Corynebacterium TaxID=1716 RepID=UPI001959B163|nr:MULTISPECIES: ABC transporter permease [Corynebacterium]MCG7465743.1 ABC transporter permease [Corynebacterium sp. ACRPJ]QRQ68156.1 ABC transporter permease [Corynebacterium tuberculostearicum]WKE52311.1 ABC transporter permease [Corynebacterium tuberculostearicum]